MSVDPEYDSFYRFTGKQRLEKAVTTLHGILQGIAADGVANQREIDSLNRWVAHHKQFEKKHPFTEVIPGLEQALSDGVLDDEEIADLLWLTERLSTDNPYWDQITCDMQELQGFLHGIIADGRINELELKRLSDWIDEREHLRTCWPYDELESIIATVMEDGVIDDQEHEALMQFFGEFAGGADRKAVGALDRETTISGVCAFGPELSFDGKVYCFTGKSERGTRNQLASKVEGLGGLFNKYLRKDTSYLVIGAAGNPCWAYACYGRKVEDAIARRRKGQRLLIVHEYDFWDAVEDSTLDE